MSDTVVAFPRTEPERPAANYLTRLNVGEVGIIIGIGPRAVPCFLEETGRQQFVFPGNFPAEEEVEF